MKLAVVRMNVKILALTLKLLNLKEEVGVTRFAHVCVGTNVKTLPLKMQKTQTQE
jgi:uncharacterized protein (UPF0212 family)